MKKSYKVILGAKPMRFLLNILTWLDVYWMFIDLYDCKLTSKSLQDII